MNSTAPTRKVELSEAMLAVDKLAETDAGRDALHHIEKWMHSRGCHLDEKNKHRIVVVLAALWAGWTGTMLAHISDSLHTLPDEPAPLFPRGTPTPAAAKAKKKGGVS